MVKKLSFIMLILLSVTVLKSQTLSQIGFILKQAMPEIESVSVICNKLEQKRYESEAKTANLVTKKKFLVYGVMNVGDISKSIYSIQKDKKTVVLMVANDTFLNERSVKYAAQKFGLKKIPLVSTRAKDTEHGAIICIFKEGGKLQKHINKRIITALNVKLSPEFEAEAVVDVQ